MGLDIQVVPNDRPKTLSLIIDGEVVRLLHLSIFGKFTRFPPCESIEKWNEFFESIEYQYVKKYLLRLLSHQNYHSNRLRELLSEKFVTQKNIDRVLSEFQERGFTNDQAWIDAFIRPRIKREPIKTILMKLRMRGIADDEIREAGERWKEECNEAESVSRLLKKRFAHKNLDDYKIRQGVIAALIRKGYSYHTIKTALDHETEE